MVRLKFVGCLGVDRIWRGGGLALMWHDGVKVSVKSYSTSHTNTEICDLNLGLWRFTRFYGNPTT